MQRPFTAYLGSEPYVFVSYSHADDRIVYPELTALHAAGVNVWYDEGIRPGSRWTDELAERVSNAALIVWFVTPNSAQSENCRNEIEFALAEKCRILLVYLKPAELPIGMKFALMGFQAIHPETHSHAEYRQKLLNAVAELTGAAATDGDVRATARTSKERKKKATFAATGLAVLTAIGIATYVALAPQTAIVERTHPLPLLIANFSNETGQAVFDGVLEEALKIGMEGAPFITSYPREAASRVHASLRGDGVLTREAARLVGAHESLELVLAGTVRRSGTGYELTVDGLDPLSGETRVTASESAESPLEALNAIATLASSLREKVGDVTKERSHLDEVFTASSIEAVAEFAKAQALAADWKHAEAVQHYERAVGDDEKFGRAYGGWAYSASVLGQGELSKTLWDKSLALLDTMTERERLRTFGIYYMTMTGNVEKAIESYSALVARYPADAAARNNLAVAYFTNGDLLKARDIGGSLLEIYPKSLLYLSNYALYNMYIADMDKAVDYAQRTLGIDAHQYISYLPLSMNALLDADYPRAEEQFTAMAAANDQGASLAALCRSDMMLARGAVVAAVPLLRQGIVHDEATGDGHGASIKRLQLARALVLSGEAEEATAVLNELADADVADRLEVERAELEITLGNAAAASSAADRLASKISPLSRAYAAYIRGRLALAKGDSVGAIDALGASITLRDNWLARTARGIAYLEAGHAVEAVDELDLAWRRRGEGLAVFLDDTPSYQRLIDLHYWRARAQQAGGMKQQAVESFERFLKAKDRASGDPLVTDAQQRLQSLKQVVT